MHFSPDSSALAYTFKDKMFKIIGSLGSGIYIWDKPEE
jgi:hypothetical protein